MNTRIVFAGGGFAGLYAAMHLDKTLARDTEVEVLLISRENFILLTPMLHEVAAGDLYPGDIVNPVRRILRHVKVVEAEVEAIDLSGRKLRCITGTQNGRREFEFDHPSHSRVGNRLLRYGGRPRLGGDYEEPV